MTLIDYMRVLRRRRSSLLLAVLLGVAAAASLAHLAPQRYEAKTKLIVRVTSTADNSSQAYDGSLLAQQMAKSYATIITDRTVVARVAARLGLEESAADVQARMGAAWVPETNFIVITAVDASAGTAQRLANGLAPVFRLRLAEIRPSADSRPAQVAVDVVEPAQLPTRPSSPGPFRSGLIGGLLGLAVGSALLLAQERTAPRVDRPADAARGLGLRDLGSVRRASQARTRPLAVAPHDTSAFADELRRLALTVVAGPGVPPVTLAVVSAAAAEGRTTIACGLAQVLSEGGRQVLLMDADFRSSDVLGYLGDDRTRRAPTAARAGLSDVLSGQATLDEVVDQGERFDVLHAGQLLSAPGDVLGRLELRDVMAELTDRYDHVVIDTPPLVLPDARLLVGTVDRFVLVARWGRSRRTALEGAVRELVDLGADVAGLVVNMQPCSGSWRRGGQASAASRRGVVVTRASRRLPATAPSRLARQALESLREGSAAHVHAQVPVLGLASYVDDDAPREGAWRTGPATSVNEAGVAAAHGALY